MQKRNLMFCLALSVSMPVAVAAAAAGPDSQAASKAAPTAKLSAAEIVDKNVAARGGLAAWRAVTSISMSGQMEAGGKKNTQLPFVMTMKRPARMRVEIEFQGSRAVQVYDGENGWKLRPYLGRNDIEPYSPEEAKKAAEQQGLDGLLIDYAAKGTKVALEGTEPVEGHAAYKLKLTLKDGSVLHDWVDAQTWLELKIEGFPRLLNHKLHPVFVYFRDYKSVNGLQIPFVMETAVTGVAQTHKMTVEHVAVNPSLEDKLFTKTSLVAFAQP